MTRLLVLVDNDGTLVGTVRTEPIDIGNGNTIQAISSPVPKHRQHILEVPDDLVGNSGKVEELHREVYRLLSVRQLK